MVDSVDIDRMTESLRHRGPDSRGLHVDGSGGIGVARLSVIDLTGNQPIHNEDSSVWIVFNGEIYNYRALREDAVRAGHVFYTESDTEVIVHLYEMHGPEAVNMLDGMFAFCLWDKNEGRFLIARDRAGEKPLYYVKSGRELIFASEPRAILRHPDYSPEVDLRALKQYFVFGYVPSPSAIYSNMNKLPPGHMMVVTNDGTVAISRYYFHNRNPAHSYPKAKAKSMLVESIRGAVRSRLVSDVPLGVLLSGGVDSGLIASFVSETLDPKTVNAFTIGFKDSTYDESSYALVVAKHLGITTNLRMFTDQEVLSHVSNALAIIDEPIADPSFVPTYLVSLVARDKVTVVLTGDGGDEVFGGYPKYMAQLWLHAYTRVPVVFRRPIDWILERIPESVIGQKGKRVLSTLGKGVGERNMLWVGPFQPEELESLFISQPRLTIGELLPLSEALNVDPANAAMSNDFRYALGDLFLSKVDRASMACSLETRAPFLAYDVLQFADTLDRRDKVDYFHTKILLKEIALDRLPRKAVQRKKRGFGIPISSWLKGPLREFALSTLSRERIQEFGVLSYDEIHRLLADHLSGRRDNSAKIWSLIVLLTWHDNFIKKRYV